MDSSDESGSETTEVTRTVHTHVSVETRYEYGTTVEAYETVPSPPPLPGFLEERSGSVSRSRSSSSSSSSAPGSSHSGEERRVEVEESEEIEVPAWRRVGERFEAESTQVILERKSPEAKVEVLVEVDEGRTSRRSSSSSSSSASERNVVMERRGSTPGPEITLYVKVGNTGLQCVFSNLQAVPELASRPHKSPS